jgi:ABC-type molybdenum transport system ATPase subunit/photorepair protein PhrA
MLHTIARRVIAAESVVSGFTQTIGNSYSDTREQQQSESVTITVAVVFMMGLTYHMLLYI